MHPQLDFPMPPPPAVLCISGHDPSGGAGIHADIQTLTRLKLHPCSVITALTVQDTHNVYAVLPQRTNQFLDQLNLLLTDMPIAAIKIGLLGNAEIAMTIAAVLKSHRHLPVVLDPVLAAGGGKSLARENLVETLRESLLPLATVVTPNSPEARKLAAPRDELDACAAYILGKGAQYVLLTGTHEPGEDVVNRLYGTDIQREWIWPRLPHQYHGSGCTLAAALAGYLALGLPIENAARAAQEFTWDSLRSAYRLGTGQWLPNRFLDQT